MRFYQASIDVLPESLRSFLEMRPGSKYVTPDDIFYRALHMPDAVVTFILAKKRNGVWELQYEHGTKTHNDLPDYKVFAEGQWGRYREYEKFFFGRLVRTEEGVLVAFWRKRAGSDYYYAPEDEDVVQEAVPALYRTGLVSRSEPIWVFGTTARLVYQSSPEQTDPKWHDTTKADRPQYSIGGRQYSYIDLAQALHALPKASQEFQEIASFLRSTDAPELQGLKSRIPAKSTPGPAKPVWYEIMKPENLESLGPQSRIDKYWDSRVGSRRYRIACILSGIA